MKPVFFFRLIAAAITLGIYGHSVEFVINLFGFEFSDLFYLFCLFIYYLYLFLSKFYFALTAPEKINVDHSIAWIQPGVLIFNLFLFCWSIIPQSGVDNIHLKDIVEGIVKSIFIAFPDVIFHILIQIFKDWFKNKND